MTRAKGISPKGSRDKLTNCCKKKVGTSMAVTQNHHTCKYPTQVRPLPILRRELVWGRTSAANHYLARPGGFALRPFAAERRHTTHGTQRLPAVPTATTYFVHNNQTNERGRVVQRDAALPKEKNTDMTRQHRSVTSAKKTRRQKEKTLYVPGG